MNLFQRGDFVLASGARSDWKLECDALAPEDWAGLAAMAVKILPPFGFVEGVPRGGIPFAVALRRYAVEGCRTLIIAEDVLTTGGSMERFRIDLLVGTLVASVNPIGVVVFARGRCPDWVIPIFQLPSGLWINQPPKPKEEGKGLSPLDYTYD